MGKIKSIIAGHTLAVIQSQKELYERRLKVCKGCSNYSVSNLRQKCTLCGCTLTAKLRLKKERCPEN